MIPEDFEKNVTIKGSPAFPVNLSMINEDGLSRIKLDSRLANSDFE